MQLKHSSRESFLLTAIEQVGKTIDMMHGLLEELENQLQDQRVTCHCHQDEQDD